MIPSESPGPPAWSSVLLPHHWAEVSSNPRQAPFPVQPLCASHIASCKSSNATQLSPGRVPHTQEHGIPTMKCSTPQKLSFSVLKSDTELSPTFAQTSYL